MKNTKFNLENSKIGNNQMTRHLTIFIALFAIFLDSAAIVSAQQMVEEPTVNDLEQFRSDLGTVTREVKLNRCRDEKRSGYAESCRSNEFKNAASDGGDADTGTKTIANNVL